MSFNPDQAKQAQEVAFSKKNNQIIHPPLYFNNANVKLTHTQKQLGFQLKSKRSFNQHADGKISKSAKGIGLLR